MANRTNNQVQRDEQQTNLLVSILSELKKLNVEISKLGAKNGK
tara:strand:- start:779 stop:907 length:129 start_codon:yes stop_codon:yes gene_type:complete